jgi:WD40 repeat protein
MGAAVVDWRRRYVADREQEAAERTLVRQREEALAAARAARRRLRRTRIVAASMAVLVLIAFGLAAWAFQSSQEADKGRLLSESARETDRNTQLSLAQAVEAYQVENDADTREAVLMAASAPRSRVVAGPSAGDGGLLVAGMVVTPAQDHVVAYDRRGAVRVVDSAGSEVAQVDDVSGLRGDVVAAAVAPDASSVVLATHRGDVAIVDMATGRHVGFAVDGPPASLSWMAGEGDDLVLVVDAAGAAETFDVTSGSRVASFPGVAAEATPSADGLNVITSDVNEFRLRVWDARTAAPVVESAALPMAPVFLHSFGTTVVALLPTEGAQLAVWDWSGGLDPSQHELGAGTGEFVDSAFVTSLAVDEPAGRVSVATEKEVRFYDMSNGAPTGRTPQLDGWIHDVSVPSESGPWLATAGTDAVLVWDARIYRPVRPTHELRAHDGDVTQVEFLSGGDTLVSRGEDGTVRLWRIADAARFAEHLHWVFGIDFSGDGQLLATASRDGKAYVLDPEDLSRVPLATLEATVGMWAILFDPTDEHRLFTLPIYGISPETWRWSDDGEITTPIVLDAAPLGPRGFLTRIAISGDGRTLAAGASDGAVHLWDTRTGRLRDEGGLPATGHGVSGVAFHPDGEVLAAATENGLRLQDTTTGRVRELAFRNAATVVFDPTGRFLASTSSDGVVRIWNRDGSRHGGDLGTRSDAVRSLTFSSNGGLIAGGTATGLVQIWSVQSSRTLMLSRHHSAWVNDVRFVPGDSATLISASDDGSVARWDCRACSDPAGTIEDAVRWVESN